MGQGSAETDSSSPLLASLQWALRCRSNFRSLEVLGRTRREREIVLSPSLTGTRRLSER